MTATENVKMIEYRLRAPGTDRVTVDLIQWTHPTSLRQRYSIQYVPSAHLCFGADDIEATYERLLRQGVEFVSPPVRWPPEQGGWIVTFLYDPDGNLVELNENGAGRNVVEGSEEERWAS